MFGLMLVVLIPTSVNSTFFSLDQGETRRWIAKYL